MRLVVQAFACIFGLLDLIQASRPASQEEPTPQAISISISASPGRTSPQENLATSEGTSVTSRQASSQNGPASQKEVPLRDMSRSAGNIHEPHIQHIVHEASSESPTSHPALPAVPEQPSSPQKIAPQIEDSAADSAVFTAEDRKHTTPQKAAPPRNTSKLTRSSNAGSKAPSKSHHQLHISIFSVIIAAAIASVPSLLFIAVFWFVAKRDPVAWGQVESETRTRPRAAADQVVAASTVTTTRNPHLDNAKFVLMVTILWMHIVDIDHRPWSPYVKQFVYFNTMGFAFISGHFASSSKTISKVCSSIGIPLVMYLIVLEPILSFLNPMHPVKPSFMAYLSRCLQNLRGDARDPTWYLYSLFYWNIWNIRMPHWTPRVKLAFAVVVSQLGGPIGHEGSCFIPTAMMYFPAFVLGTVFPFEETMSSLTEMHYDVRSFAMAYLLTSCYIEAVCINFFASLARWPWTMWNCGAESELCLPLSYKDARPNLQFLFFGVWNLPKVFAFIYVCPQKECFITKWGKYTLYPYLLHHWLLDNDYYIRQKIGFTHRDQPGILADAYQLVVCFAGTAFLSSWPVRAIFGCMIQPTVWRAMIRKEKDDDEIRKA